MKSAHGVWSHRWTFILAATGSAVGLGNIWKFPYITGENGGGAFVLVYLLCIAVIGIPIMMAEVFLGRTARENPINAIADIASRSGTGRQWQGIGLMGVLSGIFIMSFYSVIAGWALHYIIETASGTFNGAAPEAVGSQFNALLASPSLLLGWHSAFTLMTFAIVAGGVTRGLGSVAKYMMPFLLLSLVVLLGYGMAAGNFARSLQFLFSFDFSKLTTDAVLIAMGHAFFTLSLGMGAIMAYGAYMPQKACIGRTVLTVGFLDTAIALVAGLAIFPIVFANSSIEPSAGPGLLFVSLPVAFGQMPFGLLFGTLFFMLVAVAAWSSAVSLIEPAVAWLIEQKQWQRFKATALICGITWLLGLLTVLSFNHLADFKPSWLFHFTPFDFLDFLTAQVMLPLGGLLIAVFVAWKVPREIIDREFSSIAASYRSILIFLLRYVSPLLVGLVMTLKLIETFSH